MIDTDVTGAPKVDPDPFTIGIALFSAMAGGAAFLETRRSRVHQEQTHRRAFRAAWFETQRSLIFFRRAIDEFASFAIEDGYSRRAFRIGAVRLTVDARRKQQMRRLKGQALTTANTLSDNLDDLSEFLGPDDQDAVNAILTRLTEIDQLPERYSDLVRLGHEVVTLYEDLVESVGEREGFGDDGDYSTP